MKRPKITILTDPLPWGKEFMSENARRIARLARNHLLPHSRKNKRGPYRGHFAVTRSLVQGLKQIGASFNYNPRHPSSLADTVIVLAGVRSLHQAIRFKRRGQIRKLYAGPNIVVFASDYDSVLASPEIDWVITPSNWVVDMYVEDIQSLKGRCFAWPAGVDTDFWKPDTLTDRDNRILIFEKQTTGPIALVQTYADYLGSLGWTVHILQYGSFTHSQYLRMLKESCLMLGFAASESQGIAWAEAWAADVPTLLWKNTSNIHRGRRYNCSTAPYLCPENGLFFADFDDFVAKFAYWQAHREQFKPREWTLKNMSDKACASTLYKKITEPIG